MAKFEPYKNPAKGNRWTIDADENDELNYVANVTQWMLDNVTAVASFDIIPVGVTVLLKGSAQGEFGALLPAKLKVTYTGPTDTCATFRVTTTDGQKFDKTIWFNKVEN